MTQHDVSGFGAESAPLVSAYLESVRAGLCAVDRSIAEDALQDIVAYLLESLDGASDAGQTRSVLAELGEPDVYAAQLCAEISAQSGGKDAEGVRRVLGMPYEFRLPTAERVASRWWDPSNPKLLVPRVFGIGWDLNFGALAVALGLIEPDAEDEPFAATPEPVFVACLMVPLGLLGFLLISYAMAAAEGLPRVLPVHWGFSGRADGWAPALGAFVPLVAVSAAVTMWAVYSVLTRRPPLLRGAVIALAAFASGLAGSIWALTLLSVAGIEYAWMPFVAVAMGAVVLPLGVLTVLARFGRRAEIERDLKVGR